MDESCHSYQCFTFRISMSHVSHIKRVTFHISKKSRFTYQKSHVSHIKRVTFHISMRRVSPARHSAPNPSFLLSDEGDWFLLSEEGDWRRPPDTPNERETRTTVQDSATCALCPIFTQILQPLPSNHWSHSLPMKRCFATSDQRLNEKKRGGKKAEMTPVPANCVSITTSTTQRGWGFTQRKQ